MTMGNRKTVPILSPQSGATKSRILDFPSSTKVGRKIEKNQKSGFFVFLFFCLFVFLFFCLLSSTTQAISQIEELKQIIDKKNQEITELEKKAAEYKGVIDKAQKEETTLKKQLKILNAAIDGLNVQSQITAKKIERIEVEIDKLFLEVEKQKANIERNKKVLGRLIKDINQSDGGKVLFLIVKSRTLSDAYNSAKHVLTINNLMLKRVKILKNLKAELESQKAEEENKKATLENLKAELNYKKEATEAQKNNKNLFLVKTRNQEKKYQTLLSDVEKIHNQTQEELEAFEEKLRLAIDPKSLPPPKSRFFDWPVKGLITSNYGNRIHPINETLKFHNGIDIEGDFGTPIKTPYNGKISAAGDSDKFCWGGAYGKWLVIDHENNLATMYAHLSSIKVRVGQAVKKGDLIGLVGNTGYSTGPHLHFTVYDQRTLDIRPSRVCGLLPFGGSIDPLIYL